MKPIKPVYWPPSKREERVTERLAYANPLPTALSHYARELEETLDRLSVGHERVASLPAEGLSGVRGRLTMLVNALCNASAGRKREVPTVQIWPSLGLLEARLWSSRRTRNLVVIHDPIPLRRQAGFDGLSRWVANQRVSRYSPRIVSHSDDALRVAQGLLPGYDHIKLLHPVLSRQRSSAKTAEPTLVVAGQYKPQRNLELLMRLGPWLRSKGIRGLILGRGWPDDLPGWVVSSRFVTEQELDVALASAWVVLIPYNLYFQSGIAVRALELGTVSISPRTSFFEELMGEDLIVEEASSLAGYRQAILAGLDAMSTSSDRFDRYVSLVDENWGDMLGSVPGAERVV